MVEHRLRECPGGGEHLGDFDGLLGAVGERDVPGPVVDGRNAADAVHEARVAAVRGGPGGLRMRLTAAWARRTTWTISASTSVRPGANWPAAPPLHPGRVFAQPGVVGARGDDGGLQRLPGGGGLLAERHAHAAFGGEEVRHGGDVGSGMMQASARQPRRRSA
jgi:hypothetical protein